jgi:hypothetical protein
LKELKEWENATIYKRQHRLISENDSIITTWNENARFILHKKAALYLQTAGIE